MKGYTRARIMPALPINEDFESFTLSETDAEGGAFAYPALPWIGARFKFDVREREGSKVLSKTVDNRFFQRATVFIGTPDMSNYTVTADVLSEGNRRKMSEVGLINQRYMIILKGNEQKLEVNSTLERLRVSQDFKWQPNVWYRLKAQVTMNADGSAVVRAKSWKRGDAEPSSWSIEVPHRTAHTSGSAWVVRVFPAEHARLHRQHRSNPQLTRRFEYETKVYETSSLGAVLPDLGRNGALSRSAGLGAVGRGTESQHVCLSNGFARSLCENQLGGHPI